MTTALVDDNLLVRLNAKVGDVLKIGDRRFRIAAVIAREPDRMSAGIGLGPRVMITRQAMLQAGLLGLGSRATERYLFKLDDAKQNIAGVRAELEKILPDAQITDFRETNPELTKGLDHATGLLSLICLVAMVLGAIGVGMAMRAHLQQRIEVLAIMKSMGATSNDILRIYLLQTIFLGLAGGLIGVALGLGVEYAFPSLLGTLLAAASSAGAGAAAGVGGFGYGNSDYDFVLSASAAGCSARAADCGAAQDGRGGGSEAALVERLSSGQSAAVAVGFDHAGGAGFPCDLGAGVAASCSPMGAGSVGGGCGLRACDCFLWLVGAEVSRAQAAMGRDCGDCCRAGGDCDGAVRFVADRKWFAASLCAILLVILGLSALTLRGLRAFLAKTRLHLPSSIRHGLANLYRPGNQSSAVLAALGTGVMLILAVFLMQSAVVREMHSDVAAGTPNIFLVDIAPEEIAGVKSLLAKQPGVEGALETIPFISSRMVSIDGVSVEDLKVKNYPKRLLRSVSLTWSDGFAGGDESCARKVVDGEGRFRPGGRRSCSGAAASACRFAGDF